MADVIEFNTTEVKDIMLQDQDVCKIALDDLNKNIINIKDLFIFYVDKDTNNINMIETDVSFQHKAVMLQLLQHSLSSDLKDIYADEIDL